MTTFDGPVFDLGGPITEADLIEIRSSFAPDLGMKASNLAVSRWSTRVLEGSPRELAAEPARIMADLCLVHAALWLPDRVQPLLDWGADPNAMRGQALVMAAQDIPAPSFQKLLDGGADPNLSFPRIVIQLATGRQRPTQVLGAIEACLRHGADPFQHGPMLIDPGPQGVGGSVTALSVTGARPIVAAILRVPEGLMPTDLIRDPPPPGYSLMHAMAERPDVVQRISGHWRADHDRAAWIADLLVRRIEEAWVPTFLAHLGIAP